MFWKKKCKNCGSKLERKYDFCPYCGLDSRKKDGLLDEIDENKPMIENFGFGFNSSIFNKLVSKVANDLEKQFQNIDKMKFDEAKNKKNARVFPRGLSISISSNGSEPVINVRRLGDDAEDLGDISHKLQPKKQEMRKSIKHVRFTKEQEEKLRSLPKIEPSTLVRRLSNKVIYEIDLPGAKKEDVMISKFKESIEIKAFTKDKIFIKIIPVGLPILRYYINNGKLSLELKPEM